MSKRGGSLAFPSDGPDGTPGYSGGMTLRQYYKGKALAGLLATRRDGEPGLYYDAPADRDRVAPTSRAWIVEKYAQAWARNADILADAMLAEEEADHG
ncbi:MAG TPA: hypothetical protein VNA25_05945 [Phycisphaerae bacterium]|nr:hypothetical protein [Phycisphaerae bacterium]